MLLKFQNIFSNRCKLRMGSLNNNPTHQSHDTNKSQIVPFRGFFCFLFFCKKLVFLKNDIIFWMFVPVACCARAALSSKDGRGCDWQQTGRQRARLDFNSACVIMVDHTPRHHLYLYGCIYTAASERMSLRIPVHWDFLVGV